MCSLFGEYLFVVFVVRFVMCVCLRVCVCFVACLLAVLACFVGVIGRLFDCVLVLACGCLCCAVAC